MRRRLGLLGCGCLALPLRVGLAVLVLVWWACALLLEPVDALGGLLARRGRS